MTANHAVLKASSKFVDKYLRWNEIKKIIRVPFFLGHLVGDPKKTVHVLNFALSSALIFVNKMSAHLSNFVSSLVNHFYYHEFRWKLVFKIPKSTSQFSSKFSIDSIEFSDFWWLTLYFCNSDNNLLTRCQISTLARAKILMIDSPIAQTWKQIQSLLINVYAEMRSKNNTCTVFLGHLVGDPKNGTRNIFRSHFCVNICQQTLNLFSNLKVWTVNHPNFSSR